MDFQLPYAVQVDGMTRSPSIDRRIRIDPAGLPGSGTVVFVGGLTRKRSGVTLWVPRGGQGAKRTEAARKIGQIEFPLVVALDEEG